MKTTYLKILAAFFLLIFIAGCGTKEKQVRIGISIGPQKVRAEVPQRWIKDRDYLVDKLESKGAKVFVMEAEGSVSTQTKQVEELATKNKIDVLIIVPVNSETAGLMVDNAKRSRTGLKVIAYDRLIKNCMLDFYLSFDNVKVGELQADYITKIKPKGKYAIIGGSQIDNNAILAKLGHMNVLQPLIFKGDVEIVLDHFVDRYNPNIAYQILDDYLSKSKDLDAIISMSDELSTGISMALEKHNMSKKVLLSGQDALPDACKRILQGKQTMTVYKFNESLAQSTANVAIQLAKGESVLNSYITVNNGKKMVPSILLQSMIPVTKENIRATVLADGYLDEKELLND